MFSSDDRLRLEAFRTILKKFFRDKAKLPSLKKARIMSLLDSASLEELAVLERYTINSVFSKKELPENDKELESTGPHGFIPLLDPGAAVLIIVGALSGLFGKKK